MCSCGAKGGKTQTTWTVTYPGGNTETKTSQMSARLAAAKVQGATYTRNK